MPYVDKVLTIELRFAPGENMSMSRFNNSLTLNLCLWKQRDIEFQENKGELLL